MSLKSKFLVFDYIDQFTCEHKNTLRGEQKTEVAFYVVICHSRSNQ